MSSQNQPRWAWWVVGILIPVLGIGVSISLANKSDSGDDKSDTSSTATTGGGTGGGTTGGGDTAPAAPPAAQNAAPAKLVYGPSDLTVGGDAANIVLDESAPLAQATEDGSDLGILFNIPPLSMITTDYAKTMAVLPAGDTDPTAAECAEAISKRGADTVSDLKAGMRICAQTDEGRTAYLKVTRASYKAVTFQITAWA